ncbi:MAG TPA: NAD-dependent epimerase/dehydratase family protein [Ferruginibacter sp.]|nr:NAD-dependent epimerase/dehydratase family protein [Bacteroidota bacterium]MCC6692112.1 NAD-dependent epimerase/dehydratase family protein [Chitinophagaceae bacterium]HMT97277.1 NAD-dependent epimerase/dehydratase family protein [Ferruginibacter sp.]HMU25504.1 NAD-dependent epimerase/dehydratase family protein [Ferruginibacter sp.]
MNLKNKKVLVTGGAGFVGSNLVKKLIEEQQANVTVLDDLFTGNQNFLKNLDCRFVHGSVEDDGLVNQLVKNAEVVFHLAARNIIVSNANPREDLRVNVGGTFNILEACKIHGIERVVYSSTASVYGNPKTLPIPEDAPKEFLSFYSASKFSGEVYAQTFYEVFNVPVAVVRYSNVYGYNQLPLNPYCGVIGKFIEKGLKGDPLLIHGDGEQTRDYTFVTDAVEATVQAAINARAIGQVYNIGTGVETSVKHLAETIIQLTGEKSKIEYVDKRDIDNIRKRYLNIDKIRHELKFSPFTRIENGLKNTIDWYKNYGHA